MAEYSHILLAVDLTEESRHVADRAAAMATAYGCRLSCVHVIEPLSLAYGGDIPMDLSTIQEQIQETARAHLTEFALDMKISNENQHLIFGRPETEIDALAQQIGADLIVVGILHDPDLRQRWEGELASMRERINGMRTLYVQTLKEKGVGLDFSFIERQRGMFSFSGLNKDQVGQLRDRFAIYIVGSGRINVAAITPANVDGLCEAIARVL